LSKQKPTRILIEKTLTKKPLTERLLSSGATGWYLLRDEEKKEDASPDVNACSAELLNSDDYLLHWTRRRIGPWPEQSEREFLDDLIFRKARSNHSETAALRRILATRRLIASNELTRGAERVVCFSDITLHQLKSRRVYRKHLGRWDFEPFGIAIKKSWLKEIGCREVVYGDDSIWETLGKNDRPFFQLNHPDGKVDWSVEKEWRIIGDVDLRKVPVDAAVVFVNTQQDAKEVGGFSRWPIVVLEDEKRAENEKHAEA